MGMPPRRSPRRSRLASHRRLPLPCRYADPPLTSPRRLPSPPGRPTRRSPHAIDSPPMPVGRPAAHLAVLGSPHTIDSPSHAGSPPTPSPPHADNRPRLLPFRHRLTFRENLTGPDRRRRAVKRAIVPVWGGIPPQTGHERGLLHVGVSAPELDEVRERPAHVKPPVCRLERPARPRSRPLGSPPAPARLSAAGMPTPAHLPTPSPPHAGNRLRLLPFRHRLTFREIWRAPTDAAAQSNVQ